MNETTISEWQDIIPLVIPNTGMEFTALHVALIMICVGAALIYLWIQWPKLRIRKQIKLKLKQTETQYPSEINKQLSYDLKKNLCQYLECNNLIKTDIKNIDTKKWREFVEKLQSFQFQSKPTTNSELRDLLKESLKWVAKTRSRHG